MSRQITFFLLVFLAASTQASSNRIDPSDSVIVRKILDAAGWQSVPVASVTMDITKPGNGIDTILRITYLDLTWRSGLPKITVLSSDIAKLAELSVLSVAGNSLAILPREVSYLRKLTSLNFSFNQFPRIPGWVTQLGSLQVLIADHNGILDINDTLQTVRSLKKLSLGNNGLTVLPSWIGNLIALQTLVLDSNDLVDLPSELTKLTNLSLIDMRCNHICNLSSTVSQWLNQQANSFNFDWRATQRCTFPPPYSTSVTDPTGSGVIITLRTYYQFPQNGITVIDRTAAVQSLTNARSVKAVEIRTGVSNLNLPWDGQMTITFPYDPAKLSGIPENELAIWHNAQGSGWMFIDSKKDPSARSVTAKITRFGIYALAGMYDENKYPSTSTVSGVNPHQCTPAGRRILAISHLYGIPVTVGTVRLDGRQRRIKN